jgi:hypothetical protein
MQEFKNIKNKSRITEVAKMDPVEQHDFNEITNIMDNLKYAIKKPQRSDDKQSIDSDPSDSGSFVID